MRLKNTSFRVDLVPGSKAGRLASILIRRASIKRKSRAVVGLSEGAWACGLRVAITYIGYKTFMQKHLSQPTFQSTEERQEGSFHSWGRVGSWKGSILREEDPESIKTTFRRVRSVPGADDT